MPFFNKPASKKLTTAVFPTKNSLALDRIAERKALAQAPVDFNPPHHWTPSNAMTSTDLMWTIYRDDDTSTVVSNDETTESSHGTYTPPESVPSTPLELGSEATIASCLDTLAPLEAAESTSVEDAFDIFEPSCASPQVSMLQVLIPAIGITPPSRPASVLSAPSAPVTATETPFNFACEAMSPMAMMPDAVLALPEREGARAGVFSLSCLAQAYNPIYDMDNYDDDDDEDDSLMSAISKIGQPKPSTTRNSNSPLRATPATIASPDLEFFLHFEHYQARAARTTPAPTAPPKVPSPTTAKVVTFATPSKSAPTVPTVPTVVPTRPTPTFRPITLPPMDPTCPNTFDLSPCPTATSTSSGTSTLKPRVKPSSFAQRLKKMTARLFGTAHKA